MRTTKWPACGLALALLVGLFCSFMGCGKKEKTTEDIESSRQKALSQQDEMKALGSKMKSMGETKAGGGE